MTVVFGKHLLGKLFQNLNNLLTKGNESNKDELETFTWHGGHYISKSELVERREEARLNMCHENSEVNNVLFVRKGLQNGTYFIPSRPSNCFLTHEVRLGSTSPVMSMNIPLLFK